jgi:hypothetical protein
LELILWSGDHQEGPNEPAVASVDALGAWLGIRLAAGDTSNNFHWLINQPEREAYLDKSWIAHGVIGLHLTMQGWVRYHALKS